MTRSNPAKLRLFCLPYAGGSAHIFADWADALPAPVTVHRLELPGRGLRFVDPPEESVDALVDDLSLTILQHLDLPFALFGHSLGGIVAFELARRLQRDIEPPVHLFVSAVRAPDSPPDEAPASSLSDAEFHQHIRGLNGTPQDLLDNEELMQLMLPVLRADFTAADSYRYRPGPPLRCPITAFGSRTDPEVSVAQLRGWRRHTSGRFTVRVMPGDHFFLHSARGELLTLLADALSETSTDLEGEFDESG
jgi:medium-chain acyl-[acyl-carrier-protein] hydrolase